MFALAAAPLTGRVGRVYAVNGVQELSRTQATEENPENPCTPIHPPLAHKIRYSMAVIVGRIERASIFHGEYLSRGLTSRLVEPLPMASWQPPESSRHYEGAIEISILDRLKWRWKWGEDRKLIRLLTSTQSAIEINEKHRGETGIFFLEYIGESQEPDDYFYRTPWVNEAMRRGIAFDREPFERRGEAASIAADQKRRNVYGISLEEQEKFSCKGVD